MIKIKLTKEESELFDNLGTVVVLGNGDTYKFLPYWLKETKEDSVFETHSLDSVPEEVKEHILEMRNQTASKERLIFSQKAIIEALANKLPIDLYNLELDRELIDELKSEEWKKTLDMCVRSTKIANRRNGKSTRLIDEAIQELFKNKELFLITKQGIENGNKDPKFKKRFIDGSEHDKFLYQNRFISRFEQRLKNEHESCYDIGVFEDYYHFKVNY
jgi:hypothetical protein